MKNILEKKAKKYVDLCNNKEIKELAYKWVLFQYKIEELNDFIDTIRAEETLQDDMESENIDEIDNIILRLMELNRPLKSIMCHN